MKIFLICPVRNVTPETARKIESYVRALEAAGHQVHWPPRNTDQNDHVGTRICGDNGRAIDDADEVHVWYDPDSRGSIFDLGMYFMVSEVIGPRKRLVIANPEDVAATDGRKGFNNVLLALAKSS